ncbi:MAG: immunoglobulin domain-containing protein [Phycisphaerae bacterium]
MLTRVLYISAAVVVPVAVAQTTNLVANTTVPTTGADIAQFDRTTHYTFDLRGRTFGAGWVGNSIAVYISGTGSIWNASDERAAYLPLEPSDPNGPQCLLHNLHPPGLDDSDENRLNTRLYDTFLNSAGPNFVVDPLIFDRRADVSPSPKGECPAPAILADQFGIGSTVHTNGFDFAEWNDGFAFNPITAHPVARVTFVVPPWGGLSRTQSATHSILFATFVGRIYSTTNPSPGTPYVHTVWQSPPPGVGAPGDCNGNGLPDADESDLAPRIIGQPASLSVCNGESAVFEVEIAPTVAAQYQWRRGGQNLTDGELDENSIIGARGPRLVVSRPRISVQGDYSVVVTTPCGTVTSDAATLTVRDNTLTFVEPPEGVDACEGDTVVLSAVIGGSATPIGYQWYFNSAEISGANESTLTLPSVSPGDAGLYRLRVWADCVGNTSNDVRVNVAQPPLIARQPSDVAACAGMSVALSGLGEGTALIYRWRRNGEPISGAISNVLTISSARPSDAGVYELVVRSADGCVTVSQPAQVSVTPIVGDLNYDATVDIADLAMLLTHYGADATANWEVGDLSGDQRVDLLDLALLLTHFGESC